MSNSIVLATSAQELENIVKPWNRISDEILSSLIPLNQDLKKRAIFESLLQKSIFIPLDS
jgi:hypothetical protein